MTSPPRHGDLVPSGPTDALLCVYPFVADINQPLGPSHRLTGDPARVAGYLNGLPTTAPDDMLCGGIGRATYVIVFGYQGRRSATVVPAGCGWERGGAVRYGGDLRAILGYWNLKVVG